MKHHPDRNPDNPKAEEHFKEAKEAYETLSDGQKRAAYDQHGHAAFEGGMGGGSHSVRVARRASIFPIFSAIFSARDAAVAGAAMCIAAPTCATTWKLRWSRPRAAPRRRFASPRWRNARPATAPAQSPAPPQPPAPPVAGMAGAYAAGLFSIQQTCPRCHGNGKIISLAVQGLQRQRTHQATQDTVGKNSGGRGHGRPYPPLRRGRTRREWRASGDLYVVISIKPHAVFQRDHNDLHCEMPISFSIAALGGSIEIPTLDGVASIKIPAETQSGKIFRLRGKGIKGIRSSGYGDLHCHVVVETPINLTEQQKELLREFEAINDKDSERHNPRAKSWMNKVKDFFAG